MIDPYFGEEFEKLRGDCIFFKPVYHEQNLAGDVTSNIACQILYTSLHHCAVVNYDTVIPAIILATIITIFYSIKYIIGCNGPRPTIRRGRHLLSSSTVPCSTHHLGERALRTVTLTQWADGGELQPRNPVRVDERTEWKRGKGP